jgi:hypothetical protein
VARPSAAPGRQTSNRRSSGAAAEDRTTASSRCPGGKDSVYLIYKLKTEYGLRVLAHTTDIDIGPVAKANIDRAVAKLDVEHVTYRPSMDFYRRLFRWLLMNQEARGAVHTISYVYASLFEGNSLRLAMEHDIPLILAGYSPGQPLPERMEYEFPRSAISEVDWTPPELIASGEFSEADLGRFWNPKRYRPGRRFLAIWRPTTPGATTRTTP